MLPQRSVLGFDVSIKSDFIDAFKFETIKKMTWKWLVCNFNTAGSKVCFLIRSISNKAA